MVFIISTVFLLYVILILRYRIGWKKIGSTLENSLKLKVSVIIAMRNEEQQIITLFKSLNNQTYPSSNWELIIVNDHSTDNTLNLVKKQNFKNLLVLNLEEGEYGKKRAIEKAIKVSKGEIILTTDADCSFSPQWIQKMTSFFKEKKIQFVAGPVYFYKRRGVFASLQTLEFTSLIGSGAAAIGNYNAIFCNGANMAYRKSVFYEVNNYEKDKSVSGDDVFFLHNVKNKYSQGIVFAKDNQAIVYTEAVQTLSKFINQRKRWTAKTTNYKDSHTIYISFLVLLVNIFIIYLFLMSFVGFIYFKFFVLVFILKFLVDIYFLNPVLRFFKREDLIKWIFPFELFYSFYIVLIVILSFTKSFEWKDRIHKK